VRSIFGRTAGGYLATAIVCAAATPIPGAGAPAFLASVKGRQIAAVVYAQTVDAQSVVRDAQSRIENTLAGNGITVLDPAKARELRNVFKTLENPDAFVTAEDFVRNAEKLRIEGLLALYVNADAGPGLADYFTASASVAARFISEKDATVRSLSSDPMGAPGCPPSDGLTRASALLNAAQRALDQVSLTLGLDPASPAVPQAIPLSLEAGTLPAGTGAVARTPEFEKELAATARLDDEHWRKEQAVCTARAPGGARAAGGTYLTDTDFHRRPPRLFGSRVHLVDLRAKREVTAFECHPVEKSAPEETGIRKVLDCRFVGSWRHLASVTGNALFLWDTERGQLVAKLPCPIRGEAAALDVVATPGGTWLAVTAKGAKPFAARIVRSRSATPPSLFR
jgi:hypothetical protein